MGYRCAQDPERHRKGRQQSESDHPAVIEKEFQVDGPGSIDVRFSSGRLTIREGSSGHIFVRVDGKTDSLNIEQSGSTVSISNDRSGFLGGGRYQITVDVPTGCALSASVASADIESKTHLGRLDVNTASGDIRITSADELNAKTASGDVHGDLVGRCSFASASGDIRLNRAEGKFEASTASGDVYVDEATDDMTSSTLSGDLNLKKFSGENLRIKAVSGSARVGIPAGTAVSLDATTRSGDIRLPEPSADTVEPTGHTNVTARLVSGDLTIKRV
jgi:DUF4097 and DUF4098 domain-containing protein YvlB